MKKGFIVYKSLYEPIKALSRDQKGELLEAIFEYQTNNIVLEDMSPIVQMAFMFFKNQFDIDQQKYDEKCAKARESVSKRWERTYTNVYERIQPNTNHTDKREKRKDESKKEEDTSNKIEDKTQIELPWLSDNFKEVWNIWKKYKKEQHRFTFKSETSEQTSLNKLAKDSNGDEQTAIAMIEQSIANGYKGLFEIKKKTNGTKYTATDQQLIEAQFKYNL